eukprot:1189091-Heterocapsa_arctica.AAC.1
MWSAKGWRMWAATGGDQALPVRAHTLKFAGVTVFAPETEAPAGKPRARSRSAAERGHRVT